MMKNITRLEHIIDGKIYHFTCDIDSPLQAVKEALFQFIKFSGTVEDQAKALVEQQEAEKNALLIL